LDDLPASVVGEVERGLLAGTEAAIATTENEVVVVNCRGDTGVFLLLSIVVLHQDANSLLVNGRVLVRLEHLELVEAAGRLNTIGEGVGVQLLVNLNLVTNTKGALDGIKGHVEQLRVGELEQSAKRLNAAVLDEEEDLVGVGTRNSVGNTPSSLLTDIEAILLETLEDGLNQTSINSLLDLRGSTGQNVGDSPASFLANTRLGVVEERKEGGESSRVNNLGCGLVISGHQVTDGTESRDEEVKLVRHEEGNQTSADASLSDSLLLLVLSVGKEGQSPESVDDNLLIGAVNKSSSDEDGILNG
jgi:hypothetical protein